MAKKRKTLFRICSLLLVAALLVPSMGPAARAEGEVPPAPKEPEIRLIHTLTDDGKYLELGLNIHSGTKADATAGLFQHVGAVLKIDTTMLTPIQWGKITDENPEKPIPVGESWISEGSIAPTKNWGADRLSGKMAKIIKLPDAQTAYKNFAYLYLGAESPVGMVVQQDVPAIPETPTTKNVIPTIDAPIKQVVTVRFAVAVNPDTKKPYTHTELIAANAVSVLEVPNLTDTTNPEVDLLLDAPLPLVVETGKALKGLAYIADNSDPTTAGQASKDVSFAAYWVASGKSVDSGDGGSGSADVSKIRTITLLDWDGVTKLGVIAVQAGDILSEDAYKAFLSGKYDPGVMALDKIADDPYALTPIATEGYVFNPDRMTKPLLTDKGGYTFIGWVLADAEFSHYAKADETEARNAIFDWDRQKTQADANLGGDDPYLDLAVGDYVNPITENIDVKACYLANSKCGLEGTTTQRYYTLEYGEIERSGANYSVEVVIKRYNIANAGVFSPRMYEPILKLVLTPNGSNGNINLSVPIKNKDVVNTIITIPNTISRGQLSAADIYGKNGSAATAVAYSRAIDLSNVDNTNRQNYIKFGTVNLMNENARKTLKTITDRITGFTSAGYFNTDLGIVSSGSAAQKSGMLLKAWRAANEWTTTSGPAGDGILDPARCVSLTFAQTEAVLLEQKNVYLKNVSFVDTDARAEYIGGDFVWQEVAVSAASWPTVKTETNISGYKIYWSRDGITKRAEVPGVIQNGNGYSIPAGTAKQYYDRYFLICAVDGSGNELPVSAVVPIFELAQD